MIGKSALRSMPLSSGMANILGDADLKVRLAQLLQYLSDFHCSPRLDLCKQVYLHELFRPDCLHRVNAYCPALASAQHSPRK